jgi:hypothetical protein
MYTHRQITEEFSLSIKDLKKQQQHKVNNVEIEPDTKNSPLNKNVWVFFFFVCFMMMIIKRRG